MQYATEPADYYRLAKTLLSHGWFNRNRDKSAEWVTMSHVLFGMALAGKYETGDCHWQMHFTSFIGKPESSRMYREKAMLEIGDEIKRLDNEFRESAGLGPVRVYRTVDLPACFVI